MKFISCSPYDGFEDRLQLGRRICHNQRRHPADRQAPEISAQLLYRGVWRKRDRIQHDRADLLGETIAGREPEELKWFS